MLKASLIGLGRIGWTYHLPQLASHDGFDVTSVVDTSAERLDEANRQYGVSGYRDYAEMLDRERPDLVVIASPTHLHREHAVAAMNAGAAVFLDKPMAATLAEAREIVAAHESTGCRLMVYQPHRAVPEMGVLRRILSDGILGDIYMVKRANSNYARRCDWQSQTKFGGGMLNNYGAHYIDQMMYLCGGAARSVACHLRTIASLGDADDVVKIIINTSENVTIDLDINQATSQTITPWMVFGARGTLVYEQDNDGNACFAARYFDPDELPPAVLSTELAAKDRSYALDGPIPWKEKRFPITPADAVDFYDMCRSYFTGDSAPFVSVYESLAVMEIIDRCRRYAGEHTG